MKNDRISAKERGLIKGALRRVFSRSDLRRAAMEKSRIQHYDESRMRVKKWSRCKLCCTIIPTYLGEVDHREPVVPIHVSFENMSLDDFIDRLWCQADLLDFLCEDCHTSKTKLENAERRRFKNEQSGKRSTKAAKKRRPGSAARTPSI